MHSQVRRRARALGKAIRGLIHSAARRVAPGRRALTAERDEPSRHLFTDPSGDARRIFTDALDEAGVEWKVTICGSSPYNISIARHASLAPMDAQVEPRH